MYYGLTDKFQARSIAQAVCNVIGNGSNNNAVLLLLETAQQETRLGSYLDRTIFGAGVGLCQFDKIAFDDVKQRTPKRIADQLYKSFGVRLRQIQHRDLAYSPLLSFVFCRLFYRLIPDAIPTTLELRAKYWKRFYNTEKGKGSVEEYIRNANTMKIMSR